MKNKYFSPEMEILKFSLNTNVLTASKPTNVTEDSVEVGGGNELPDGPGRWD